MTVRNLVPVAALAVLSAVAGGSAMAQSAAPSGVKAGYLNCNEASGWGYVFGSSHALKCIYTSNSGHTERYTGHITKFGVDIGYLAGGVVVWAVLAPTS